MFVGVERQHEEERGEVVDAKDLLARLDDSMSTQKQFLADAAHQLKTPLAGLRMQAELAEREIDAGREPPPEEPPAEPPADQDTSPIPLTAADDAGLASLPTDTGPEPTPAAQELASREGNKEAAAVLGFVGVAAGSFGAHALKGMLEAYGQSANWETAVRYCLFHALALVALAAVVSLGLVFPFFKPFLDVQTESGFSRSLEDEFPVRGAAAANALQRIAIEAKRHRFTLRHRSPAREKQLSMMFVLEKIRRNCGGRLG